MTDSSLLGKGREVPNVPSRSIRLTTTVTSRHLRLNGTLVPSSPHGEEGSDRTLVPSEGPPSPWNHLKTDPIFHSLP